jgi:hypothetical protein
MSTTLKKKYVWVSVITCTCCKEKLEIYHPGLTKQQSRMDMPFLGIPKGWFLMKNNEKCPKCTKINKCYSSKKEKIDTTHGFKIMLSIFRAACKNHNIPDVTIENMFFDTTVSNMKEENKLISVLKKYRNSVLIKLARIRGC